MLVQNLRGWMLFRLDTKRLAGLLCSFRPFVGNIGVDVARAGIARQCCSYDDWTAWSGELADRILNCVVVDSWIEMAVDHCQWLDSWALKNCALISGGFEVVVADRLDDRLRNVELPIGLYRWVYFDQWVHVNYENRMRRL